jgi:di/tricarboxylate transporter
VLSSGIFQSPGDITPDAWYLFTIFITAIAGVLLEAFSIFTASVIALVAVVLLRVLPPKKHFRAFQKVSFSSYWRLFWSPKGSSNPDWVGGSLFSSFDGLGSLP